MIITNKKIKLNYMTKEMNDRYVAEMDKLFNNEEVFKAWKENLPADKEFEYGTLSPNKEQAKADIHKVVVKDATDRELKMFYREHCMEKVADYLGLYRHSLEPIKPSKD